MVSVALNLPEVRGNKLIYSWSPGGGFCESSYWVEYPDVAEVRASPGKLAEACFPLCLAFCALGVGSVQLPVKIDPAVLANWRFVVKAVSERIFRKKPACEIINGNDPALYRVRTQAHQNAALFLGGGTESLLTLARLRDQGVSPVILSFGGSRWSGSDPGKNPDKFRCDATLCRDLGFVRIRAVTNFMEIVKPLPWPRYLKPVGSAMNSLLYTPFFISLALPVCETFQIGTLVQGHESMKDPDEYYCFSPDITAKLKDVSSHVRYEVKLQELSKQAVCHELYSKHPDLAKYQYSCWQNDHERWCHACESCFRCYLFLRIEGLDPRALELGEARLMRNVNAIIRDTLRSPDCYADEYWGYLWSHERLRRDKILRRILDQIRIRSFFFKPLYDLYMRAPLGLKRFKTRFATPKI